MNRRGITIDERTRCERASLVKLRGRAAALGVFS